MSLHFKIAELRNELINFQPIARALIRPECHRLLEEVQTALDNIIQFPGVPARWEIERENPIITISSNGDHEPNQRGQKDIYGKFSFIWDVTPIASSQRRRAPARVLSLTGKASSCLSLHDTSGLRHAWTIEIASLAAPGCYFHTQLSGSSLPIPRLPAYPLTPFGALESLLSEMFRSGWPQRLSRNATHTIHWSSIQSSRFIRTLDWSKSIVTEEGSPIVAFQNAQPPNDLFV